MWTLCITSDIWINLSASWHIRYSQLASWICAALRSSVFSEHAGKNPLIFPKSPPRRKPAKHSPPNPQKTNTDVWWFPADNISPLAAGCERFPLSSAITLFLFISRGSRHHPSRFHTCDYSHSFRATVWRGGQRLSGRWESCVCPTQTIEDGRRQTAAHYSERKISSRFLFPFSVNLCVAVQVFVVPSSSLSTESYLEETKGRIQPVTDGSFAPPSANKWMSVLHEVAQVELMSSVARVKYSDATSLKTTSVLFLLYSTKTNYRSWTCRRPCDCLFLHVTFSKRWQSWWDWLIITSLMWNTNTSS